MAKDIVKIYGDGEIWINGKMKAKIYPDGDIYSNGKLIGKIYEDGDIWLDNRSVGRVFANGEVWIGNERVAKDVYLLALLDDSNPPPRPDDAQKNAPDTDFAASSTPRTPTPPITPAASDGGAGCAGTLFVVLLIIIFLYACFRMWFEVPTLMLNNMINLRGLATFSTYACMFIAAYLHCALASQRRRVMFFGALLAQGALFIGNIVVFTFIELLTYVIPSGFSIADAFGALGGALGGSFFDVVFIALVMGTAPTIVTSLLSHLIIKNGYKLPLPEFLNKLR